MKRAVMTLAWLLVAAIFLSGCQLFAGEEATLIPPDITSTTVAGSADASPTPAALVTITPTSTSASVTEIQRIEFEPNTISATREGELGAGQANQFVFSAAPGQSAAIELSSANETANFALVTLDDAPPYKTLDDPARSWEGVLSSSQEYLITVTSPEPVSYTLSLTIEPLDETSLPVILDPGSPPSDRCVVSHPGGPMVVTVYLGPSTAFAPIARLGNWAVVLSGENGWQQIQIGPGRTGWVRETDVVYSGPCDHANQVIEFELPASGSPYRNIRTILPGQADRYAFEGEAGSRVFIEVISSGMVNFILVGVEDGIPLKRIASESRSWEGILPGTQEYLLTVVSAETTADYELLAALVPTLPLTAIYDAHTDAILGGYRDAFWLDSVDVANELFGGERYDLYMLGQKIGQSTGSMPVQIEGICPGYTIELSPPPESPMALAVAGAGWEPAPQLVADLLPSELERQAVVDLLNGEGVNVSAANLQFNEAFGVDLDSNGFGEVIILASRLKENGSTPAVNAGDYFVAAVVMDISGTLFAEPLVLDVYHEASDLAYPWRYQLSAAIDLNGDGALEVVLAGTRWEGRSTIVYSVGTSGGSSIVLERHCAQ